MNSHASPPKPTKCSHLSMPKPIVSGESSPMPIDRSMRRRGQCVPVTSASQ
jgi:hypothetical protein